jgi:hypothetical protein
MEPLAWSLLVWGMLVMDGLPLYYNVLLRLVIEYHSHQELQCLCGDSTQTLCESDLSHGTSMSEAVGLCDVVDATANRHTRCNVDDATQWSGIMRPKTEAKNR